MRLARAAFIFLVVLGAGGPPPLAAQETDRVVERVSAGLRGQLQLRLSAPTGTEPPPKKIGVFTLVPPANPGEILRLRLPIGALVATTARRLARGHQRRREVSARLDVQAALTAFTTKPKDP